MSWTLNISLFKNNTLIPLYRGSGLQRHLRIAQEQHVVGQPNGFWLRAGTWDQVCGAVGDKLDFGARCFTLCPSSLHLYSRDSHVIEFVRSRQTLCRNWVPVSERDWSGFSLICCRRWKQDSTYCKGLCAALQPLSHLGVKSFWGCTGFFPNVAQVHCRPPWPKLAR